MLKVTFLLQVVGAKNSRAPVMQVGNQLFAVKAVGGRDRQVKPFQRSADKGNESGRGAFGAVGQEIKFLMRVAHSVCLLELGMSLAIIPENVKRWDNEKIRIDSLVKHGIIRDNRLRLGEAPLLRNSRKRCFFAFAVHVRYSFVAEILRRRQVDANRIFKQFGEEG
ncbi:hypothetical protein D3C81_1402540 [compost metagenome]